MPKKFYSLAELAEMTGSTLVGDGEYLISNVSDLESADHEDASFLSNSRYEKLMLQSKAGVLFVGTGTATDDGRNYLINDDPSRAFQVILEAFHEAANHRSGFSGKHESAVIHDTAQIGENVTIGPNAVIDQDARVGDNSFIGANCYIGPFVSIGSECVIHPNVTIRERTRIGNRVTMQPGAVLGSCGYGYTTDKEGKHHKLCQVGTVTIEDDVEIGANTTIDRSRFKSTVIGEGSKIDNLVMIAHGVKIGPHNFVVAQAGFAGSTETGPGAVFGGQVGIAGHLKIAGGVAIAAKSGVTKDITEPGNYGGAPALPAEEFYRNVIYMRKLAHYMDKLKSLEQKVKRMEENQKETLTQ